MPESLTPIKNFDRIKEQNVKKYGFIYFFTILIFGNILIPKIIGGTMDTSNVVLIVVAIIGLIGVITTSHLSENSKWKKVNEKLEELYSS